MRQTKPLLKRQLTSKEVADMTSTHQLPFQEPLGEGTSYTLWSSQRSLKRDHRRKFNRSLCGILLGISIVLVIMGILGIIGIAVYLGGEWFRKVVSEEERNTTQVQVMSCQCPYLILFCRCHGQSVGC